VKKARRLFLLCMLPSTVSAQWWLGPPTYDYVPDEPTKPETLGVQPPRWTMPEGPLAGFDVRSMRDYNLQVFLSVPLGDVQAILPPGFTALPSAPGGNTASLQVGFIGGSTSWYAGIGVTGPVSYAGFSVPAYNTTLGRPETLLVAIEVSTVEALELVNALYGPGTARLAVVEEKIETEGDATRVRFKLKDQGLGLHVSAEAYCPYPINLRTQILDPKIWRFTAGRTAGPSYRQGGMGDTRPVTLTEAGAVVEAKNGLLKLPGGSVRLLGLMGPTVSFYRNQEMFRRTLRESE
jgi:hypothetical protein